MRRASLFTSFGERVRHRAEASVARPFAPRLPWIGADLQTVRNFVVGRLGPRPDLSRWSEEALHVPAPGGSGDVLVGRLNRPRTAPAVPPRPLVLLVHGVSGCEWSGYMQAAARFFLSGGHATLRLNLRGAGPSRKLCAERYHAGSTADLRAVLHGLPPGLAAAGVVLVGFSLGGSIVLNLLAEGAVAGVRAAAVVSAPLDLAAAVRRVMRPRNAIYHRYLLQRIKQDWLKGRAPLSTAARAAIRAAGSIRELDEMLTAPRAGHADAAAYYAAVSPGPRLAAIDVPTLLVHSLDDPWIGAEGYRSIDWSRLPALRPSLVVGGGHVGFHARGGPWHHHAIASFIDTVLPGAAHVAE